MLRTRAIDPTDAVFGITPDGEVFHINLSDGPHWLICGQTGSGKSVFVNSMMLSTFSHAHPDELEVSIIDPKKVEFSKYKGLPYLCIDPVINMGDAFGLLAWLCYEMDERYEAIEKLGVKNIADFNEIVVNDPDKAQRLLDQYEKEYGRPIPEHIRERCTKRMKYHINIIDEFADLVMTAGREIEDLVMRLAQKARAAGITCLIATQRPSADIISPSIKANVPSRIGLKTADSTNSLVAIDEAGCEKLAGNGDGIVKLKNGDMIRVQGPFICDDEIDAIFDSIKTTFADYEVNIIDYKQICVDNGLAEWVENYDTDPTSDNYTPPHDRHVKMKRQRRGF